MTLQRQESASTVPQLIQSHIPLHDKNWFATGGKARFYATPTTAHDFQTALAFAATNALDIFILGHGANILIADTGFDGLVIHPHLNAINYVDVDSTTVLVTAGAGVSMPVLITDCLQHNVIGLEEFSGIPGTVGGSVYINLHYFEFLLAQFLHQATVIHKKSGAVEVVTPDWFNFGYNYSTLHAHDYYLIDATFKLKKASGTETAFARGRRHEIIRHREKRYPTSHTCGSFFRNFYPEEVTLESHGKKIIFVAYYLDKIGVKGQLSVGDAIVSHQHANMIVNRGHASSTDIIMLARRMQELVRDHFGITPQPECQLVGFQKNPLL